MRLPFEDGRVLAAMVASSALVGGGAPRRGRTPGRESAARRCWASRPTALALKDSDLAAYHGVEHKAIAGYEQDTDAADAAKEHDRCGSNLVAPMMLSTLAGNVVVRIAPQGARPGRRARLSRSAAWRSRSSCSPGRSDTATRRSRARSSGPGFEMQRLFATREPTAEQLEVGSGGAGGDPSARASRPWRCTKPTGGATRLDPDVFRLPVEKIRDGYYTDAYFNFTKELLEARTAIRTS